MEIKFFSEFVKDILCSLIGIYPSFTLISFLCLVCNHMLLIVKYLIQYVNTLSFVTVKEILSGLKSQILLKTICFKIK